MKLTRQSTSVRPLAQALACLALICAATAHAQQAPAAQGDGSRAARMMQEFHKRFGTADKNADGKLTREEAQAGMPWVSRNFDAIDTAHAGFVTASQIEAYALAQRGKRQRPGAGTGTGTAP